MSIQGNTHSLVLFIRVTVFSWCKWFLRSILQAQYSYAAIYWIERS